MKLRTSLASGSIATVVMVLLALLSPVLACGDGAVAKLSTGATPTGGDNAIPPLTWQVTTVTPAGKDAITIDNPAKYTLQFGADGNFSATLDCNVAGGEYTTGPDGAISFSAMRTTLAMCEAGSQDQNIGLILSDADSYMLHENALMISGKSGSLAAVPSLLGLWSWVNFKSGDDSVLTPDKPENYTVQFNADGTMYMQADCNQAFGGWSGTAPELAIQLGGVTRAKCPEGSLMDPFLKNLGEVASFMVKDGHLFLALKLDSGIMEFAPLPASAAATPTP